MTIDAAITAAILAGREILKIYSDPAADFSVERKADNSPLTIADKAAHRVIVEALQETGLPVLSEEGKAIPWETRRHWKRFWLVDPLDGTKEFIKQNGEFTVNIALIEMSSPCEIPKESISQGRPVAGVIYVPITGELYAAQEGQGAWKLTGADTPFAWDELTVAGQKLPTVILPDVYTVSGSRSHRSPETEAYIHNLKKEQGDVNLIYRGSSLKICMVAEGSAHEYPRFGPTMEWDTAAGHAIINAVGKKIWKTDFSEEITYNKSNLLNPDFIVK